MKIWGISTKWLCYIDIIKNYIYTKAVTLNEDDFKRM